MKVTAHKETQDSFGSIQKSSVCFVCPQLGTLQHTTSFRNSLAQFKGNFILDRRSVYGIHVFFKEHMLKFRTLMTRYHALRLRQSRNNTVMRVFSTSGIFRTLGLSVSPSFALLKFSITSLVILYIPCPFHIPHTVW